MAKLIVVKRDGSQAEIDGKVGLSLMEIVRDAGYDEMLALCGGNRSCATCHLYIEDKWLGRLPAVTEDESDLLDTSSHRKSNSRLSCQIPFSDALAGIKVTFPPED
jgi:2Fe-2S ferredoxin